MTSSFPPRVHLTRLGVLLAGSLVIFLPLALDAADKQPAKFDVLHIGTSGSLAPQKGPDETAAIETLKSFIKTEVGYTNEITEQKDWRELSDKLVAGQLQVGVFQGFEFAWAQEGKPGLKPLALAVNVYRYPVAYVVTRKDDPAKDFAGLQGHSLTIPALNLRFLNLFLDRQSQARGKKTDGFFSKVQSSPNIEEALDDVVDGKVQAAAVDRAGLEAYKRRKPGRFNQLKPVAHSPPFPPPVVAYYDNALDNATRERFIDGLVSANKKDTGSMLLTMFRLTSFEKVPPDFEQVLAEVRKAFPSPDKESR